MQSKRDQFCQWAMEEGVSVSQLLGYMLYLDNYHSGDRNVASVGWRLFCCDTVNDKPEATLEEAVWLVERASLSQSVYLDIRLKFLDRFKLPAVMHVTAENRRNRPVLTEYKHGVKAPLLQCLSLTLNERLTLIDLTGLDLNIQVSFKFNWG